MGHANLLRSDGLHEGRLARQGVFCIPFDRSQGIAVIRLIAVQLIEKVSDQRVVLKEESQYGSVRGSKYQRAYVLPLSPAAPPIDFFQGPAPAGTTQYKAVLRTPTPEAMGRERPGNPSACCRLVDPLLQCQMKWQGMAE